MDYNLLCLKENILILNHDITRITVIKSHNNFKDDINIAFIPIKQ